MNDLAARCVRFLVEHGASSPAAIAASVGIDADTVARLLGALTQPPARVERISPLAGATCWCWQIAGRAPASGSTAREMARRADASTAAEVTSRATERAVAAAPGPKKSTRRQRIHERLVTMLREHGPLPQQRLAELAGCSAGGVANALRTSTTVFGKRVIIPNRTKMVLCHLDGQDLDAAEAKLAAMPRREQSPRPAPAGRAAPRRVRACRVCGCTDDNCEQCVAKIGERCHWIEEDLCSACRPEAAPSEQSPHAQTSAFCKLFVPAGTWGVGFDLVVARATRTLGAGRLEAALADPDFGYETVDRHGLVFVRRRQADPVPSASTR